MKDRECLLCQGHKPTEYPSHDEKEKLKARIEWKISLDSKKR